MNDETNWQHEEPKSDVQITIPMYLQLLVHKEYRKRGPGYAARHRGIGDAIRELLEEKLGIR